MSRCAPAQGVGQVLLAHGWNLPLNDRLYYPLYAECIELNIPFCTQVGHTDPSMPFTNDEVANHCTEFPDRFAGVAGCCEPTRKRRGNSGPCKANKTLDVEPFRNPKSAWIEHNL